MHGLFTFFSSSLIQLIFGIGIILSSTYVRSQTFDARFVSTDTVVSEYQQTIQLVFQRANTWPDSVIYDVYLDAGLSSAVNGQDVQFNNYFRQSDAQTITYDTLKLEVLHDYLIEDTEHVYIVISNCDRPNLAIDTLFHLTILPSDTLTASFLGAGFSFVEDSPVAYVPVTLTTDYPDTVRVMLVQAAGSAEPGIDYVCADTQLITWAPFTHDTFFFPIQIINDDLEEINEQVNFDLINLSNNALLDVIAYTLTIVDNDSSPVQIAEVFPEKQAEIALFPNPFSSQLTILSERPGLFRIQDLRGNEVGIGQYAGNEPLHINTEKWAPGIYCIRWVGKGLNKVKKIIKL